MVYAVYNSIYCIPQSDMCLTTRPKARCRESDFVHCPLLMFLRFPRTIHLTCHMSKPGIRVEGSEHGLLSRLCLWTHADHSIPQRFSYSRCRHLPILVSRNSTSRVQMGSRCAELCSRTSNCTYLMCGASMANGLISPSSKQYNSAASLVCRLTL